MAKPAFFLIGLGVGRGIDAASRLCLTMLLGRRLCDGWRQIADGALRQRHAASCRRLDLLRL